MPEWEPLIRLALAALAGLVVGFERELHGHPAGMRTHTLVAVGAAMFTLAGSHGFPEVARSENVDPARIAAQVASGIGFIGAGAILRDGMGVRGITTAATLWLGAALGVAAGAGVYPDLLFGTVLVLVLLTALRYVKPWLGRFTLSTVVLHLEYEPGHGTLGWLIRQLNSVGGRVANLRVYEDSDSDQDDAVEDRRGRVRLLRRVRVPVTVRDPEQLYQLV